MNRFRVFIGGTFQFNVGPEGRTFILHSKLVSRHSSVFHALMCGHMKEAEEKQTCLSNVDEDSFARFAEFIYGGDYNADVPLIVLDGLEFKRDNAGSESPKSAEEAREESVAIPPRSYEESESGGSEPSHDSKKRRKRGNQIPIRKRLGSFSNFTLPSIDKVSFPEIDDPEAGSDTGLMYDYAEALCHVRLYVFAEQYQINKLKDLALCKLHSTLENTTFRPLRVKELCDLIRLAYQNTPELTSKEEPLRSLLTHYVAWRFEELAPTKKFQELFIDGGIIVNDLCQKVSQRL